MRQLIINADDLGADEARNAGILEAIQTGIVTSTSILANGPALEDALRRIRSQIHQNVSFGIHINLSEGKPLSSNLRLLTGQGGCFLKKTSAHELLMRPGDRDLEREISQELANQIEALLNAGVRIDHLDGHQHVHVFPAVLPLTIKVAQQYKIPWIRIPEEPYPVSGGMGISPVLKEEAQFFSRISKKARLQLKGTRIQTPTHFRGLYLKGRLSLLLLFDLLQEIPPGLTELMVHPGRVSDRPFPGPFSAFSTSDREKELEALIDQKFQQGLENEHISLMPFPREQH